MSTPTHAVAIIGGATAGAEVAARLARAGAEVVVFDMNARPFGKIEDGLPKWHRSLRQKEYGSIASLLSSHPAIHYVPRTKIGREIEFSHLITDYKFSAVVLACGAWRDRPLPVEGAERYIGSGLVYQNPFIIAYNQMDDSSKEDEASPFVDDAMVVGGGLASIDVCKVFSLETTRAALLARGHPVGLEELEKKGIPATLEGFGISWESLGLLGPTLYYRRRPEDMPLVEMPEGASPSRASKIEDSRRHILKKAMEKFCFRFEGLCIPDGLIVDNQRLCGLRFSRAKVEGRKLVTTSEKLDRRATVIVSSIGSIPEPIDGIPMRGELFGFNDMRLGRLEAYANVFSAGNVVTGKGNIIASRRHAVQVAEELVKSYLGVGDPRTREAILAEHADAPQPGSQEIMDKVRLLPKIEAQTLLDIRARVRRRQQEVGYDGDLAAWIQRTERDTARDEKHR